MRPDPPALRGAEAAGDALWTASEAATDARCTALDVGSAIEVLAPQADSNPAISAGIAARVMITSLLVRSYPRGSLLPPSLRLGTLRVDRGPN